MATKSSSQKQNTQNQKQKQNQTQNQPPDTTNQPSDDAVGTTPQPRAKRPPAVHFATDNYYFEDKEHVISLPIRPDDLDKSESDKFRNILKRIVMDLEAANNNTIIVYHRDHEWWQIGGNSLFFYKYYLQNEYGLTNIIPRRDNDHGCRWLAGNDVGMIKSIDNFRDNMKKTKADTILDAPELLIFRLTKTFTASDINAFHHIKEAKLAHINTLLTPKVSHPHIKQAIDNLTTTVVNRIEKMRPIQRELYGIKGADALLGISYRFFMMSDGGIDEEEYYTYALGQLKYFMTWLAFTQKFNIFNVDELVNLADKCADLKEKFENELHKARKKS